MTKNAKKKDPRENPLEVLNALARMNRKTCDLFRNELDRLCGVSAPRDTKEIAELKAEIATLKAQLNQ